MTWTKGYDNSTKWISNCLPDSKMSFPWVISADARFLIKIHCLIFRLIHFKKEAQSLRVCFEIKQTHFFITHLDCLYANSRRIHSSLSFQGLGGLKVKAQYTQYAETQQLLLKHLEFTQLLNILDLCFCWCGGACIQTATCLAGMWAVVDELVCVRPSGQSSVGHSFGAWQYGTVRCCQS